MANEKRLIQQMAERLIKAFPQGDRNNPCPFVYYETFTDIVWDIADQMVDALEDAPTVDAVEVVHGRWEEIGVADYKCSRCGFRFTSADPISMFQYCRCGAKMDGERRNDGTIDT